MQVVSEELIEGVLWRIFRNDDGSAVPGHPYTSLDEEAGDDGWYAVIRQDVPSPEYLNPPEINALQREELWRSGPYQYRWQAREAAWNKDAQVCAEAWRGITLRITGSQQAADEAAASVIARAADSLDRNQRPVWNATSGRKAVARRAFWWAEV